MDVKAQVAAARRSVLAVSWPGISGGNAPRHGDISVDESRGPRGDGPGPVGARTTLTVVGRDRVSWLNGLVTCDLVKRRPGQARYGLFVVRNGRVLADALVVVDDERVLVSVPAETVTKLVDHLEHYLVMEDAEFAVDGTVDLWTLYGPSSEGVLQAAVHAGGWGGDLDRTGLGGAIVFAGKDQRAEVTAAIGAAATATQGVVGDAVGWNALRLETGVPEFGVDFGEATYPQEATLEKIAVSFDKGCYLGQEVVCMLELRGHVKRKLVTLVLEGGEAPAPGASVTDEGGAAAGEVTSSVTAPTLGRPVAMAMIKRAFAQPGHAVLVGAVRAKVVERVA